MLLNTMLQLWVRLLQLLEHLPVIGGWAQQLVASRWPKVLSRHLQKSSSCVHPGIAMVAK
eukprot:5169676-Amphidinium_carterae.1